MHFKGDVQGRTAWGTARQSPEIITNGPTVLDRGSSFTPDLFDAANNPTRSVATRGEGALLANNPHTADQLRSDFLTPCVFVVRGREFRNFLSHVV